MLKYIREKVKSFLIRLFKNKKFKQLLWNLLIQIIEVVRGNDEKTQTDS